MSPRYAVKTAVMEPAQHERLIAIVNRHGRRTAEKLLNTSKATLETLRHGGLMQEATVKRIVAAMDALDAPRVVGDETR